MLQWEKTGGTAWKETHCTAGGGGAEPLAASSPFGALSADVVPLEDFMKLTRIPIVIYYGDCIADAPTGEWHADNWRVRREMARKFADAVNRRGGDAQVVSLLDLGIRAIPMSSARRKTTGTSRASWRSGSMPEDWTQNKKETADGFFSHEKSLPLCESAGIFFIESEL